MEEEEEEKLVGEDSDDDDDDEGAGRLNMGAPLGQELLTSHPGFPTNPSDLGQVASPL